MNRTIIVLTCLLVVPVHSAVAQDIPAVVKVGTTVSVIDDQGREIKGRVDSASDRALRVLVKKDRREIPFDSIVRIEKPDGVKNGALAGLLVGVSLGIMGGFVDGQGSGRRGNFVVISAIGNGIIWAGLGTGIDAMINTRRTLYERGSESHARITPMIGPRAVGAAVSVNWP